MGQSCGLCKFGPDFFLTAPTLQDLCGIPNLLQGQISGRNTVVRGAGGHLLARSFISKSERSEQRTGMWIEVALLLPLFFLLGQNLPSILDRKSSNLLPPESESTFSIVTNN